MDPGPDPIPLAPKSMDPRIQGTIRSHKHRSWWLAYVSCCRPDLSNPRHKAIRTNVAFRNGWTEKVHRYLTAEILQAFI